MSDAARAERLHATCVAIDGEAVLLLGESGSGKSDVALRLIDGGARLVADDQTLLERDGARLLARGPGSIAGKIEARGVGILDLPAGMRADRAPLALAVALAPGGFVERLPEPQSFVALDVAVPLLRLDPREASTPAKIRLALRARRSA